MVQSAIANRYLKLAIVLAVSLTSLLSLEKKEFWHDESLSLIYAAGKTSSGIADAIRAREIATGGDLVQIMAPSGSIVSVAGNMLKEDPLHPPLFYICLGLWIRLFGDSIFTLRLFSLVGWLLCLVAISKLEKSFGELEGRPDGPPLLLPLLFAVSPYFFVFGQEVREYVFLVFLGLLSTVAMLGRRSFLHGILLVVGFCTSYLMIHFLIAQLSMAFARPDLRLRKSFVKGCGLLLVLLLPLGWDYFDAHGRIVTNLSWMNRTVSPFRYVATVLGFPPRVFFDVWLTLDSGIANLSVAGALTALILISLVGALVQSARRKSALSCLALSLLATGLFSTIGLDLLNGGGIRALSGRYWLPCMLAFLMMTAEALRSLESGRARRLALGGLLAAGLVSIAVCARSESWWNKGELGNTFEIARAIKDCDSATVYGSEAEQLLTLAFAACPSIHLAMVDSLRTDALSGSNYLFKLPDADLLRLKDSGLDLQPVTKGLWTAASKAETR